jgi:hypothetical protein
VLEELHTDWEESHTVLLAELDKEEHPVGPDTVVLLVDSGIQVALAGKEEHLEDSPG